jgi:hypothetical protein
VVLQRIVREGPGASPCLELEPNRTIDHVLAVEFTSGLDSFTLCDGVALPVAFTSIEGNRYELEAEPSPPGNTTRPGDEEPTESPPPGIGFTTPSFPLYAEHPEVETNFTTEEAHREARNRVEA